MTHCPTCGSPGYDPVGEPVPPPATSSAWARIAALQAAKEAVDRAKRQRTTVTEEKP